MLKRTYLIALSLCLLNPYAAHGEDYDYDPERTAILLVDPYNDFLSEGGLLYDRSRETLEANNAIENMKNLITAARAAGIKVIYVPHHQSREGDKIGWKFGRGTGGVFKAGTWAAEYLSLIHI